MSVLSLRVDEKVSDISILCEMPSYCYVVKGWSPRDGGWVRLLGYFRKEQDAWDFIDFMFPLLEERKDIEGVNVIRTIRFKATQSGEQIQ